MFFKTDVVRNVTIFKGKHLLCSLFFFLTAYNFILTSSQNRPLHKCFPENIAKLLQTAFFIEHSGGCFCQFDKVTFQWEVSANLLLLIKTKNKGYFLLKRFVDLFRVRYFHIISRSHSNTLLLINLNGEFPFTATCSEKY